MSIEFQQVEAQSVRERVVRFMWDQQHWPGPTLADYYEMWDWRYSALSDGEAFVYIACEATTGDVVGHIAVYPRRFRIDGACIKVGVPGNLLVHKDYRATMVGPRLASFPRSLVSSGALDAVLAFANAQAHEMFLRLGFHELGVMHSYIDLRRTRSLIRRRLGPLSEVAPLVDAGLSLRRSILSRRLGKKQTELCVRHVRPDAFSSMDRSHWSGAADRLVAGDSSAYVVRRFLECPYAPRELYAVTESSGLLQGYVVLEGDRRVKVWDCQVNRSRISEAAAIARVVSCLPGAETVTISALPDSQVAADLTMHGFVHTKRSDYVERETRLSALWRRSHPLAEQLADVRRWNIWLGTNHY